ncbi:7-alpha-hydroxysteroid dehydrogenase domain protein [Oesophagostomum dentatum]|uniref:7-alpha-hydroxysteroid dehydrogenase domain protein n=1 Tax=Oesophagostomum dentatum TaxID=61180 RepID=A0A0B1RXB9_OESDE|nr:7-alpha-hydroxysteroid dehydrogenase domain protein [Oesophagostomum dentatum]
MQSPLESTSFLFQETKRLVLSENGNDEKKIVEIIGDVTDEEVLKSTIDKTVQKFKRLDVLVNNAGGTSGSIFMENELDDISIFDYVFNLNTRSVLRLCQLAIPHLIKTKGEIVNVSSVVGLPNGAVSPCQNHRPK